MATSKSTSTDIDDHHNAGDANNAGTELSDYPRSKGSDEAHHGHRNPLSRSRGSGECLEGAIREGRPVEGLFAGFEVGDLVETPGKMESVLTLWVFFIQKIGLQVNVDVSWPPWFSDVLMC